MFATNERAIERVFRTGLSGLAALWLTACTGHTLTGTLGRSASVTAPAIGAAAAAPGTAAASPPAEVRPVQEGDLGGPGCTEANARDNCHTLTVLVGYPVEDARQRAQAAGFVGTLKVYPLDRYDASCKDGTVCRVDPKYWEIEKEGDLRLYVNPKVAISAPE